MIAPVWGVLGLLWLLVRRWPVVAAASMGGLSIFAGAYYGDVYGQFPTAVLFLLATAVVFLPGAAKDRGASAQIEAAGSPERRA